MAAPLGDRTRLDAALDAAVAVARRRRRARRPLRRDRVRRRDPAARCRRAGPARATVVRALFDLEPRAGRQRLRARVPARRRAPSARSCSCSPTCSTRRRRGRSSTRCRCSPRATRSTSRAPPTPSSTQRFATQPARPATSTARPSRSTCSTRAPASAARLRRAGADVVEAPPDALAAACVRRVSASQVDGALLSDPAAPEHEPPVERAERDADADAPRRARIARAARGSPRRGRRPRATAPCRARSRPRAAPRAAATAPRRRVPGSMIAQPSRSPAAPPTTMHDSSSTPCAATSSTKPAPLPGADRQAADHAEQHPL